MPSHFNKIQTKLEQFIRKYYTNELIKGAILFFSIGLLYFLIILLIEHFLWLDIRSGTLLFWLFIIVELILFSKFIIIPLAKLFKLQKGIDHEEASLLIGEHFPQVNDKLLNVLQLNQSSEQSELLLASIEQKSIELTPIPFKLAVNFKKNLQYLKYAAVPLLILLLVTVSGRFNWFSESYERVVNYKTAFEPPAPFQFFVVNNDLNAIENKDFKLAIKTVGEVIPEDAQISFNNETYFLQSKGSGSFEFTIPKPKQDVVFQLSANNVTSKPYTLYVTQAPTMLSFDMFLDYPGYTKKRDETLKSTGNAVVPQGTKITWKLNTKATETVKLYAKDTLLFTPKENGVFEASKRVYNDLEYALTTSNSKLRDYENLAFSINVIRDEFPELNIKMEIDSLDQQSLYFFGQASDDYGLSKLQIVYYPSDNEDQKRIEPIPISNTNITDFVSAFPNQLRLEEGISYDMYFEVFDNDVFNKYKSTKSEVFSYRKRTKEEEEQKQLQEQNETIQDLNKSLDKFEEREKELQELSKTQKEKSELSFNDKRKLENFLKRQKQQDEMMKNFNEKLKENLEQFQQDQDIEDTFKEDLKERLKENEEQLKEDEKLLEELEKLREKLSKEELSDKLEKLAKQNKNKKRSLEQLLELTKRYYVSKKLEKLQQELEKLAKKQDDLSNQTPNENTKEEQEAINKAFEEFQKQMAQLEKDNKELKQPTNLPRDKKQEEAIENDLNEAKEKLEEQEQAQDQEQKSQSQQKAKQKQKQAAQKMQQMSEKMKANMSMSAQDSLQEDAEMLRQILDNLVLFSFDQENLMKQFKSIEVNHNKYASYLRKQSNLREHFSHIDDSLFALSLRQPKLSERVNKEITEVFYNIDKSLEQFSENRIYKGVANQQFTITSANNLADFLSNSLDNMQMQMNGQGQGGQGQPEQGLPDIIMSQEQLNEQMKNGMKKSEDGQPENEGEKGQKGDKEGQEKGEGKQGQEGGDGEQENSSELLNGELYSIYKKQQQIRQALQDKLAKEGKNSVGSNLVKQIEQIEMELLNKGFTERTLQKMQQLEHQLLKLENATFQQGQEEKRESESNKKSFSNTTNNQIPTAKQYFKTTEILNRQSLPLQPVYKKKVQEYFKKRDD